MHTWNLFRRFAFASALFAIVGLAAGCAMFDRMTGRGVELSGTNEVPPVSTQASGTATIRVNDDRTVSGRVSVSDMQATAAHIHQGGPNENGPVAVGLQKTSDTTFRIPEGAKLTEAQYNSYKAGNLYVNVHSAKHKGGEVRGQLRP